jgi:serine/threonine protein kinase
MLILHASNKIGELLQTDFAILVQDYAHNGDLYTFLHKQRNRFSERKIIQGILLPCMDALAYLHARNIAHRDVKPENLLLDADNNIMLADFGLSVCVEDENAVTRAGTMDYMAPEVLVCPLKRLPTDYKDRKDLAYSVKVDSWSIGVLAFELIVGRTPFRHRDEEDMLKTIKTNAIKFPSNMSSLACDWIKRAMTFNAHDRASIQELACHPWITSNVPNTQSTHSRMRASNSSNPTPAPSPSSNHLHRQQIGSHPEAVVRRPCALHVSMLFWHACWFT